MFVSSVAVWCKYANRWSMGGVGTSAHGDVWHEHTRFQRFFASAGFVTDANENKSALNTRRRTSPDVDRTSSVELTTS